jgi:hypothetical protein
MQIFSQCRKGWDGYKIALFLRREICVESEEKCDESFFQADVDRARMRSGGSVDGKIRLSTGRPPGEDRLLKKYWSIPERQIETSVVLVEARSGDKLSS